MFAASPFILAHFALKHNTAGRAREAFRNRKSLIYKA